MSNVRQYIGARYVFKIYENTTDPSSAEWQSGVAYEPLTIVTYLNSTYASKKDVPASVGDPASNPNYWVITGAYNGQIATLQQQVDNLNNTVIPDINDNLQAAIDSIDMLASMKLSKKLSKIIFFGDSYDNTSNWVEKTVNYLGLSADDYINLAVSGSSLSSGQWVNYLQTWVNDNPDAVNEIKSIVLGGGINDSDANHVNTVQGALQTFITYVKDHLPNATCYLAYFGWAIDAKSPIVNGRVQSYRRTVQNMYNIASMYGYVTFPSMISVLHNIDFLESDLLHPNNNGGIAIARNLANCLCGSEAFEYYQNNPTIAFTDANATQNGLFTEILVDDVCYLSGQYITIDNLSIAVNSNLNQFFTLGTNFSLKFSNNMPVITVNAILTIDGVNYDRSISIQFIPTNNILRVYINGSVTAGILSKIYIPSINEAYSAIFY